MKNFLILQSSYSLFFNELGLNLKKENQIYSLCFSLGDKYLKSNLKNALLWKEIKEIKIKSNFKEKISEILKIDNLYFKLREKVDEEELTLKEKEYFYKYYKFLEKYLIDNKIDKIVMMNDLRWQHAIAIHLSKKLNIKYFVFELGLFRPNTITLDSKGVNYNNSVPKDKEFYLELKGLNKFDYTKINSDITEKQRNIVIAKYMILNMIGKLFGIYTPANNRNSILDYFKRFKNSYLKKKDKENITLENKYIFAPLQVKTDTQTLVHSDYKNMIEFMEDTIQGVKKYREKYNSNIELVFKEHPMDCGKVLYDDFYIKYKKFTWIKFLKGINTKEVIKNSEMIITINSTVGLEAIEMYKPVICMGRSFFTIDGIAKKSNSLKLADDINDALKEMKDKKIIDNFLNYLRYEYSIEGNLYYYNEKQIKEVSNIILGDNKKVFV